MKQNRMNSLIMRLLAVYNICRIWVVHTHTHIHTHTHTPIRTHTLARTHARTHTSTHTDTQTHTFAIIVMYGQFSPVGEP